MWTCSICYHAVLVRIAFDVPHHPLSLCCSLLQSPCPQQHRGHYPLSLVLHLSCPRGFSLCVPSLCSTPAHVLRSLQSGPPLTPTGCVCPPSAFLSLSRCLCEESSYIIEIDSNISKQCTLQYLYFNSWRASRVLPVVSSPAR